MNMRRGKQKPSALKQSAEQKNPRTRELQGAARVRVRVTEIPEKGECAGRGISEVIMGMNFPKLMEDSKPGIQEYEPLYTSRQKTNVRSPFLPVPGSSKKLKVFCFCFLQNERLGTKARKFSVLDVREEK